MLSASQPAIAPDSTPPKTAEIPRFRGNESAVARFGQFAIHRMAGVLWLYRRQELVGHIDGLGPEILQLSQVRRVLADARDCLSNWGGA